MTASAATSATTPAAATAVDTGDLVNDATGKPAQERYPGAVDATQYTDAGATYPLASPPYGSWQAQPFVSAVPESSPGGGIQDTSWMTGYDAPQAAWDSNAGAPFAPSGPPPAELHAEDTGAVYQALYSPAAFVGNIERHTITGQTYNREFEFDPVQGQWVPSLNGRINYDQQQTWDPAPGDGGGWNPWDPGYAERPIYNNVAYEATPVSESGSGQGVSGALPDRAPVQSYVAQAYEAPSDPVINQTAAPAAASTGSWWSS